MSEINKPRQFTIYYGESGIQASEIPFSYKDREKRYETMTNYPQHEINHALLVEAPYEASEALEKVVEILKG